VTTEPKAVLPGVILLDLDDTVLHDSAHVVTAWQRACDTHRADLHPIDPNDVFAAIDDVRKWFWSDPERHRVGRLNMGAARRAVVSIACSRLGIDRPELADRIGDTYSAARDADIQPIAGAIETIAWLRHRGCRLALLTNGAGSAQRRKIDLFNLAGFFEHVLIEGELGFGKPDPRIFQQALTSMAASPSDTWMVGDNLEWDVAGAQRHGIFSVWVDREGQGLPAGSTARPDWIVRSLADLRQP